MKAPPAAPKMKSMLNVTEMSKVRNNLGKTTGWIHSSLQAGNVETINRAFR